MLYLRLFLLLVAAAFLAAPTAARAADKKLNVLLLFSDDQRADTIAALGNRHIKTPNLDKLVERGMVFDRAYCMGSMSGAVCIPSRAMLHTGRTLWRTPHNMADHVTLGQNLRRAGYAAFGTGKWHNGADAYLRSFSHGGGVFLGGMGDHVGLPVQRIEGETLTPKLKSDKHSSELFADEAVAFLRSHQSEQPFFCYVAFTAPHDPRQAPAEYRSLYDAAKLPLPANYMPEHPFDNGEMKIRDEKLLPWPRTPEAVRGELADYYAMITHMDAQIGRILAALQESGHADNTLIVFASDHGLAIGSHGLLGKQNLYEHSMRAPLIFTGPGIKSGRTSAFAYLLDIYPTICDFVGMASPQGVDGKSLVPVVRGETKSVRESIFTAYQDKQRAVRDDRWKLIRYKTPQGPHTQLFDLSRDPHELRNLAEDSEYAETLQRLDSLLVQQRTQLGDPVVP